MPKQKAQPTAQEVISSMESMQSEDILAISIAAKTLIDDRHAAAVAKANQADLEAANLQTIKGQLNGK